MSLFPKLREHFNLGASEQEWEAVSLNFSGFSLNLLFPMPRLSWHWWEVLWVDRADSLKFKPDPTVYPNDTDSAGKEGKKKGFWNPGNKKF